MPGLPPVPPYTAVPADGADLPDPLARHQARQNQQIRGDGEEREGEEPLEQEEREREVSGREWSVCNYSVAKIREISCSAIVESMPLSKWVV